ncbi:MAG: AMP-binding protein [Pseudomonadota bacterium]|nr:AMP-binding protein [Pseudomonadota bacterium]
MTDFAPLRARLAELAAHSPQLARQLAGVDLAGLHGPVDLARIPLLRKSELSQLQRDDPPFAGVAATTRGFRRLFMSPGPIFEGEDHGPDPFGAKAAFAAAGFSAHDIVLNCFSYHLTPGAFIMESGAQALGCAVIPAGPGNSEQTLAAIAHLQPTAYAGPPDFLKILLDKAGGPTSIRKALVSGGALPASLRAEMEARGVKTRQTFATAELGVIAYETDGPDGAPEPGLKVAGDVVLEIVRPGSGDPLPPGQVGEIVVTALRGAFPLLRFATGDLSTYLAEGRIRGWLGRADQTTKVKGMFVHPSAVIETARRHPELIGIRLVVRRDGEQDSMTLIAETANPSPALAEAVAATLQAMTKMRGKVEFVAPGALPNDGKTIADERPVG